MSAFSPYERKQYAALCRWRDAEPTLVPRAATRTRGAVGRTVGKLIPAAALRLALESSQRLAEKTSDQRSILRRAGADSLADLVAGPLQRNDALARRVGRRSMALAGGSGALFGVSGALGLAADIPTLLVIAFRSIQRVGLCYGEDCMAGGQNLPLAIFALASANNGQEKRSAWEFVLAAAEAEVSSGAVRSSALRAANHGVVKSTAALGFNRVARQVSARLGWCLAGGAIPFAGAVIGGSVNAWYLREVTQAAQRSFQWRWLATRRHAAGDIRGQVLAGG